MRHFHSTLTSLQTPNWSNLSPEAQESLRTIALPISLGYSHAEVAAGLGISLRSIEFLMGELRDELAPGKAGHPASASEQRSARDFSLPRATSSQSRSRFGPA